MSQEAASRTLLALFARQPQPGRGKRRLAAELGNELAHTINNGMYAAALADLNRWPGPTAVALTGATINKATGVSVDPGNGTQQEHRRLHIRQPDGSFGKRLAFVDKALRQTHNGPVLFIGSDAPELNQSFYLAAAELLSNHDVVLAPATDGGVTLLGTNSSWPDLTQLPWGSDRLCEALEQLCIAEGLSVARLPLSADVDTFTDVLRLRSSLRHDDRPNQQMLLTQLRAALPDLGVVIPVKNDHKPALDLSLELRAQGADHILIIDQQRNPKLQECYEKHRIDYLQHKGNRGARLDVGARLLKDGNLWFLHADAQLLPGAADAVRQHLLTHPAGCFSFEFSADAPAGARWLAKLINWRARHFMAYGDQGLFMRRQAYLSNGGFTHEPLFEEVPLVKALKRQKEFVMLDIPLIVDSRRWQKDGWLWRTLQNRWLVIRYMLGSPPETLARRYTRR